MMFGPGEREGRACVPDVHQNTVSPEYTRPNIWKSSDKIFPNIVTSPHTHTHTHTYRWEHLASGSVIKHCFVSHYLISTAQSPWEMCSFFNSQSRLLK